MKKLIIISLATVFLGGCSLRALLPQPQSQTSTPSLATSPSPSPSAITEADKTIEISASNFTYDKKEIRVKKGEKVTIKFTNGEGFHDFVIDELEVKTQRIPEGQSETVMIPTDKIGEYAYYCSVGSHRAQGMEGKLIIE